MAPEHLDDYRAKRDFSKTAEPEGGTPSADGLRFVVQKHAARALHYDVRFEDDGVMPSWAVPKGPSYDPKVKRLAVHVEDHPLDYQGFEGSIPAGEYGGGSVIVWDDGTYRNITEHKGSPVGFREAVERGHLSVWLDGSKLHGGWSLTRTARPGQRQETWIMVKRKDAFADPALDIEASEPRSVKSGLTIEEVAADRHAATWTRAVATFRPPMLASLADLPPAGEGWVYERKLDGLRAVAVRNGDEVELWSRNHLSFAGRFPGIVRALREMPIDNFTFDGEIVAMDGDRTSFELLQRSGTHTEPVFAIFDVLHLLGNDTTDLPLTDRKALVEQAVPVGSVLRTVGALDGSVEKLLAHACRSGWEGLIGKRADAPYRSGRSRDWLKLKCTASQELVIGGWTEPRGARQHLGALLVGVYDVSGLVFAGKVGTGFDAATLEELAGLLAPLERDASPFADLTRMKGAHWASPALVANIGFSEWTADGKLRHPRFEGLRPDKDPRTVQREKATPP